MFKLPKKPTTTDSPLNQWLRDTYDWMSANQLKNSSDILVNTDNNGTYFTLASQAGSYMLFKGEYKDMDGYLPGYVVKVTTPAVYTVGASQYSSSVGTFVCKSEVPPDYPADEYAAMDADNQTWADNYRKQSDVMYAPSGSSGLYWELIGGTGGNEIKMTLCVDGVPTDYYVNARPA